MKYLNYFILFAILFAACKSGGNTEETTSDESTASVEKLSAVSIYDGVAVRAVPEKKGKYLTSLNLGETMVYLGEEKADSTEKSQSFYKVELSDGTVAWARTYGIIIDGTPATITSETPIYKRPDLVNKTEKAFNPMEFVVIIGEKSDWVEVAGVKKKKKGWIKKQYLTTKDEEVAVSTLAHKSVLDDNGIVLTEKVADFIENLPYKNTAFTGYLQKIYDESVAGTAEEQPEGYESEEPLEVDTEHVP